MVKYFYNGIKENILNGESNLISRKQLNLYNSLKRIYEKYARILM